MVSLPTLVPNASSAEVTAFSPVRWARAGVAKPNVAAESKAKRAVERRTISTPKLRQ